MKFYTLKEVEQILKISPRTMHNYIKDGKIKAFKVGQNWKISEEDLQKFIDSLETNKD